MEEANVPPPPKLTRSRSRPPPKVEINDVPEVQEIEARPSSAPKRTRKKLPEPEPVIESVQPVKIKKPRKKPEPGSVPPKEVTFNSARGPINFTAHRSTGEPPYNRSPYEHLHGSNRFSHIMSGW